MKTDKNGDAKSLSYDYDLVVHFHDTSLDLSNWDDSDSGDDDAALLAHAVKRHALSARERCVANGKCPAGRGRTAFLRPQTTRAGRRIATTGPVLRRAGAWDL